MWAIQHAIADELRIDVKSMPSTQADALKMN